MFSSSGYFYNHGTREGQKAFPQSPAHTTLCTGHALEILKEEAPIHDLEGFGSTEELMPH